ncbi:MAG: enoyl-CoA hydratase/isomerase family protein [Candidatus Helarchaeota archaeon]
MTSEETIFIEDTSKRIRTIVFNRPDVLNCFNIQTLRKFSNIIQGLKDDTKTRVVIFKGNGRAFSTGNDLKANMSPAESREFQKRGRELCFDIYTLPQITIAAIRGFALAGGFEIAISCDFRIATPDSQFGLPEIRIGLIPIWAGLNLLPKVVGLANAKEIAFGTERFDIESAKKYGLISKIIDPERFDEEVLEFAKKYTSKSMHLIRLTKIGMINSLEVSTTENMAFIDDIFEAFASKNKTEAFRKLHSVVAKR